MSDQNEFLPDPAWRSGGEQSGGVVAVWVFVGGAKEGLTIGNRQGAQLLNQLLKDRLGRRGLIRDHGGLIGTLTCFVAVYRISDPLPAARAVHAVLKTITFGRGKTETLFRHATIWHGDDQSELACYSAPEGDQKQSGTFEEILNLGVTAGTLASAEMAVVSESMARWNRLFAPSDNRDIPPGQK